MDEKEKKPAFVVTDRRKFTVEGEPRAEAAEESSSPEPKAPVPPQAAQAAIPPQPAPASPVAAVPPAEQKAAPQPSSSAPDLATGYNADKERTAFGGQKMEFMHLLDMLVQTAMMYAGALDTGAERRVDIVGLRQMIDLIGVLEEKTKGNLSAEEENVLKNTIFQLRMTYMEIVNMIDRQAMKKAPGAPGGPARK